MGFFKQSIGETDSLILELTTTGNKIHSFDSVPGFQQAKLMFDFAILISYCTYRNHSTDQVSYRKQHFTFEPVTENIDF